MYMPLIADGVFSIVIIQIALDYLFPGVCMFPVSTWLRENSRMLDDGFILEACLSGSDRNLNKPLFSNNNTAGKPRSAA
jgi:hypothetical protein